SRVSSGRSWTTPSMPVKKTASSSRTNSDTPTAVILKPSRGVRVQVRTIHSASRTSMHAPGARTGVSVSAEEEVTLRAPNGAFGGGCSFGGGRWRCGRRGPGRNRTRSPVNRPTTWPPREADPVLHKPSPPATRQRDHTSQRSSQPRARRSIGFTEIIVADGQHRTTDGQGCASHWSHWSHRCYSGPFLQGREVSQSVRPPVRPRWRVLSGRSR